MIVTTCGAAGTLSLPTRAGGAGFFGDGAGVCAVTTPQQSATKTAARIVVLKFIPPTKLFSVPTDSRSALSVVNQN